MGSVRDCVYADKGSLRTDAAGMDEVLHPMSIETTPRFEAKTSL